MRATLLLLATMAFVLIVAGGVALAAATITCPTSPLLCEGTDDYDKIEGSNGDDVHIFGYGGNDTINANGGSEHVVGDGVLDPNNPGVDGNDKLDGGADPDRVYGYGGSDTLIGGPGEDYIDAVSYETSESRNTIRGGSENDQIDANNGVSDHIDCGTGSDTVTVDLNDLDKVAKDCERVDPLPEPPSG